MSFAARRRSPRPLLGGQSPVRLAWGSSSHSGFQLGEAGKGNALAQGSARQAALYGTVRDGQGVETEGRCSQREEVLERKVEGRRGEFSKRKLLVDTQGLRWKLSSAWSNLEPPHHTWKETKEMVLVLP